MKVSIHAFEETDVTFAKLVCTFSFKSTKPNDLNVDWCYICSGSVTPDRDVYYELAKKLFGEQKISTHVVPEYMEAWEIPRYCYGVILVHVS